MPIKEYFIKYVPGQVINGITLIREVFDHDKNHRTGLFICPECGEEWEVEISKIKNTGTKRCRKCYLNRKKNG